MLEVSLALLLVAGYAAMKVSDDYDAAVDMHIKARVKGLDSVRTAASEYAARYYGAVVALQAPGSITVGGSPLTVDLPGSTGATYTIADGNHPTVNDLAELGLLPRGFADTAIGGGKYGVALQTTPKACMRDECNIEGMVFIDRPYRTKSATNFALAGRAVQFIGADGMASRPDNADVMSSYGGKFTLPNPVTPAMSGLIGIRFGYLSTVHTRQSSSLSVSEASASGTITADQFRTPIKVAGDKCEGDGSIASGSSSVLVCASGVLRELAPTGSQGDVCATAGALANDAVTREALLCKNGHLVRLSNLLARTVVQSQIRATDGKVVAKPICETGGTPGYSFESSKVASGGVSPESPHWTVKSVGVSWVLTAPALDSTPLSSGPEYVPSDVMNIECLY